MSTTKLVALGLSNPSVSVPRNGGTDSAGFLCPGKTCSVIGARVDGPIRREMTLLTANEIARLLAR